MTARQWDPLLEVNRRVPGLVVLDADGDIRPILRGIPCSDAVHMPAGDAVLRAALEELCAARGWGWTVRVLRGREGAGYIARVWTLQGEAEEATYHGVATADTATGALTLAVLQALESEAA